MTDSFAHEKKQDDEEEERPGAVRVTDLRRPKEEDESTCKLITTAKELTIRLEE